MNKKQLLFLSLSTKLVAAIFQMLMFCCVLGAIVISLDTAKYSIKAKPTFLYVKQSSHHSISIRGGGHLKSEMHLNGYVVHNTDTLTTRCDITVTDSISNGELIPIIHLADRQIMSFEEYLVSNDSIVPVWAVIGNRKCKFRKNKNKTKYSSHNSILSVLFLLLSILPYQGIKFFNKKIDEKLTEFELHDSD